MNKIFKVVWSKTKECYVVVSEVAKNNGGKKKVLASVLAGLAMVGAGAAGTPVQAVFSDTGSAINISPNAKPGNSVSTNSVVVGYQNDSTGGPSNENGKIIYGANNTANRESSLAVGNQNTASNKSTSAIGVGNTASGEASVALGNANTASGDRSIAIGSGAEATQGSAIAIGRQASATGGSSIAFGYLNKAKQDVAIAIGVNNDVDSQQAVATGSGNKILTNSQYASAYGRENKVAGTGSIAIGYSSLVGVDRTSGNAFVDAATSATGAGKATAIGYQSEARGNRNVAIGNQAIAQRDDSVAIGSEVQALSGHNIAIGSKSIAQASTDASSVGIAIGLNVKAVGQSTTDKDLIAIGNSSNATANGAVAIGSLTNATGNNAYAMGNQATASGSGSVALGQVSRADAHGALAIGNGTNANGVGATAIGRTSKASKDGSVAVGFNSEATGDGAIAIGGDGKGTAFDSTNTTFAGLGEKTTASAKNAIAIGHQATANIEGGVALGSESKTTINAGVQGYNPASDRTDKYSTQAGAVGTSTLAAVSIGDGSAKTRQLTGLAAGTADTDAVNVAQLKNVNLKYAGDTGNSDVLLKDHTLNVKGSDFITTSADGTGITVKAKTGNPITANAAGKAEAPATNGLATTTNVADAINASGWNVVSSNNGGSVTGTQATKLVNPGNTVTLSAGKNIVLDQNDKQFTYSLNKDVDLTNAGSLTIGDTNVTNGGLTITGGPSVTKTGIDAGSKVISNVADGAVNATSKDAVNGSQLHAVKAAERHIAPGTYNVDANGDVTMTYLDGNNQPVANEKAIISGIAKQDLSNITTAGETKIKNLAKSAIDMEDGKNTKASNRDVNGVKTFKVDVEGDLTGITSISNATTGPKMTFGGNSINITGGTLNMGGNKITNVGPATSGTDAVNYDQLKNSRTVVTSNDGSVTVTPTTNGDKTTYDLHVTAGAAASSWNIASDKVSATEGTVATGSAASQNIKDTKTVTMQAGKNLTVKQTNDGNGNASVAFALDKDLKDLTSVTTDKVTTKEIGLQDAAGNTTTIKKDGDRITYSNDGGTTTKTVATLDDEKHIKPGSYAVQNDGSVTMTYVDGNGNPVANTEAKITGIAKQDLSNINDAGKNVITGLGTIVKAGDNVTVSEASDATTGQKTYTVNAVTPAVYTKADGTKVVKRPNGTYTTNLDGSAGNDVAASDVIISFQDAAGDTKNATSIVNNVGSAIKNQTGGDFLTKLDNANTATPNAAVNVSDLKNTADGLTNKGLKFDANSGGVKTNKLGSTVKVQGAGTSADANYSGANIKTFIDQDTTGNTTIDVKLDKNLTGINSISNTTTGPKMEFGGNSINITGGSLNMGGSNITNLKSGIVNNNATDDTNAANIGDVKTIAKDTDLHIAPTESNRTGEHIAGGATGNTAAGAAANAYKYDATTKQVVLEYNDGNGTNKTGTKAVIDLSNLPTGGDMSSFKVTSSAESTTVGTHAGDASQEIKNGKSVDFQAGKNMTVKQTNDGNGNTTINYALNKDLDVESVHVGKDGKDGKIGIDGAAGTNGINGTTRVDIKVEKGVDGINGANGTDGISRIVYEDKTGTHTVATMDDGLKFTGNNESTENKHKLGSLVKVQGEGVTENTTTNKLEANGEEFKSASGNIAVVADSIDKLTVKLNKNLAGINKISNGNSSITLNDTPSATTPAVTISGGNLSMGDGTHNNKIVNVAPGTDDSDAVNYKQLKAAKTEVKAGENVTVKHTTDTTDNHNIYTVSAVTPAVYTKADGTKVYKIVDPTTGAVTWNTSPDGTGTVVNAGDVITSFETPANGTTPGSTTGGTMIVNNVGSAIKNQTGGDFLAKLDAAANTTTGTPNAAVNVSDLKSTADALKSNELHIRPTASNRTGETVNKNSAGTADEVYKYDATTKSVTLKYNDGTGAGVTGTEAKIDLSGLADQITSGYTFSTNAKGNLADGTTATATAVGDGKTVSFAAGKNLTVEQNIDATTGEHTYTYALSDKITAGKDGVNGKDGSVGVTGKDGSSVVINGADGSIGMTGPKGQDGKDGINGRDGANLSMTSAKGEQVLVNRDPAHNADTDKAERIVYVPKDASGNPIQDANGKNIVREVATMDDGLKFTGNNESTENKHKLGSLVKVQGEGVTENTTTNKLEANGEEFKSASGNIAVVADSIDKLTVKLNKNLAGINKISNGNSSITLNDTPSATTPAVTISGGNLSMGDGTHNNKIVNVAPGTDDSDAVNYKQLKAAKTEVKAGKNVVVTSETSTTDGHTTYTVNASTPAVYTKPDGTKLVKQPDGTFKDENGNAYTGSVIASFEDGTGATTGGNMIINNVGSAIKTQTGGDFLTKLDNANTATPNAAVNVSDLKSTADALKANERHIAPTTVPTGSTENKGGTANAAGTANVYKYDAASKTVTLTYNDGNGNAVTDTKAVIDLSNLSTGGTGASSWNVKSSANTTDGGAVDANHNANAQNIADGKSVEFQAGKNLVVKQTNDTANGNATVEFSLSDNITVGKDGANGKDGSVGAKGADGSAVVMNGKDGSIGLNGTNGANGISIKGKDGANGVGIDGKDGVTRIVYTEKVPDPANPGTTKEVTHEVATMDDGLKFTGNNTATENKHKLGSLVKVQGEGVTATDEAAFQSATGNIAVTADGTDTLTIRLNKNLKGLNSIQLGNNTIKSNGDNIEFTTNGGTTKTVATTDQLWTIQADGTDVPAKAGKVNLVAGDHITITPDAANGKMTISATGFGSMDGFNVKTSAESATVGTHAGDTTENIKNGKTVDMQAGKNLVVTQTNDGNGNTTVNYALNKDVDLGTTGSLKIGDTTINNGGLTIANGPSVTNTGVDAGSKKITNVADGDVNATSKDAVNGSQLKKYTDAAKTTVEAGDDNVKVETDNSAADGHTNYKVSLKPVVEIGDTHKVKIDGHTGDITGLTNVNLTDPTFATKGRAATEEQLKQVLTEAKNKAIEKVQAGTAAAGDTNIATVLPKAGDTFGTAGATYEVSVSKNAVKDAAKEAVKVTSASPAITVTADNTTPHETTYKVGFDGNQAATQIPLTYKQNGGNTRTVKLSDGLNFIDGTNTKARTAADGKVTFDVMGDLTGITSISNTTSGPKMTFGGSSINVSNGDLNMGDNKITRVKKGTAPTDAANVGQLTKVTSNNHSVVVTKTTDADGAPVYDLAVTGTPGAPAADPRVDMLGEEIGRVGAQGAALSALKPIQYDPLEPTQIMAGYGNYRGNSAVALGVAHYKNESTLIHGGVSWAGGSRHMMANAGVTWKVGNRDSEAAVADRYRKGPISSAYAMQQEMASVKAQNAGLKTEVSDLKAENEQMKAQIAAMMAKLGM